MAVAGIAVALSVAGTVAGVVGQYMQYDGAQKAEKARKAQAALEATRARREQIRSMQASRARAIAAATNQGAGESSALAGGLGQIQSLAGRNIVAINQDQEIGNQIYNANQQVTRGGFVTSLAGGISSLGGIVANNAGAITRLGQEALPFLKKEKTYA